MVHMPQPHFNTIPLDPQRLATSFSIQTDWYVLTGAACCGKTTLLEGLAEKGYQTIPESARAYFEMELAKGRTLEEIRADDAALQRNILALQKEFESRYNVAETTFLDRGIPDSLAFFRIFGLDPNEILPECFNYHYAGVFLLERLPFLRDQTLGPEDDLASEFLTEWLSRDYNALGYHVVRVPVLPPQERLAFILDRIHL